MEDSKCLILIQYYKPNLVRNRESIIFNEYFFNKHYILK